MSSVPLIHLLPQFEVSSISSPVKLDSQAASGDVFSFQRLPGEAIGTFSLTLTNVVVGSRIHVEEQTNEAVIYYDNVAGTSTMVLTLPAFPPGNASNDMRVKVRKGDSPSYKPYETLVTAFSGSASIYVSQTPDE